MDKIKLNITGYSRAAFRTGFYIPELDLMLDAGPQNYNKPSYIFITHGHGDHIGELPFTLIKDDVDENNLSITHIYGPPGSHRWVANYIRALFSVNALAPCSVENSYNYQELASNLELSLVIKNSKIKVKVIDCDHSVPTISFMFSIIKDKLKEEYLSLPGKEIAELRKNGVEITKEVTSPLFAYVCDCSIKTVEENHQALGEHPYVIVECTFLYEDHKECAVDTKHINWFDLKPFVLMYPETTFILIHFSLRYRDQEIVDFFKTEGPPNIIYWVGDPEEQRD